MRRTEHWWQRIRCSCSWAFPRLWLRFGLGWGSGNANMFQIFITPAVKWGWSEGFQGVAFGSFPATTYYNTLRLTVSWLGFWAGGSLGRHPHPAKEAQDAQEPGS